jgi:hypothetical protein
VPIKSRRGILEVTPTSFQHFPPFGAFARFPMLNGGSQKNSPTFTWRFLVKIKTKKMGENKEGQ